MKYLIINADDFGMSKIFNFKILELIKKELISSVSVLVNRINNQQNDQIKELINLTQSHNIGIGLHLEFSGNDFEGEMEKQFASFIAIFCFNPSHIDLHKSTYLKDSYPLIMQFCKKKNIPCRNQDINSVNVMETKNKVLNGTAMNLSELKHTIENLHENESYEIFFHPGAYDPDCKSSLNKERELDFNKVEEISPFLKENNIKLISYIDLANDQNRKSVKN